MKRDALIIFGLAVITLTAFWGVGQCDFVNYDDLPIIVNNPHITGGLSAANFAWAWKSFDGGPHEQGLYIPLTSLSLMCNVTLFGPGPHGFHWVNLTFHMANVVLVYLFFRQATGAIWRSALVAAIFAVHPLRVESVAWVVERKDVLSTFFAFLAMLAYLRFAHSLKWNWYIATLLLFAASLLAKPAVVTLPFLLLLLDFWPLERCAAGPAAAGPDNPPRQSLIRLAIEKLPLLAIAAAVSVVAMTGLSPKRYAFGIVAIPLAQRLANAAVSYSRYLGRMIWFAHLAPLYPHQLWSTPQVVGSCVVLVIITLICLWKLKPRPWLAIGWLWYLGVLVPMIGVIQDGTQSMGDRYSYTSGIGVLMMLAWSIPATAWRKPVRVIAVVGTVLGLLILFTIVQTRYWRNTVTLFRHEVDIVGSNSYDELVLGKGLRDRGKFQEAIVHLNKVVNLDPGGTEGHGDLALALAYNGQCDQALPHALLASRRDPNNADWHVVLAYIRLQNKQYYDAQQQASTAIQLNPQSAYAHQLQGLAMCEAGNTRDGIPELMLALSIKPDLKDGQRDLLRFQNAMTR